MSLILKLLAKQFQRRWLCTLLTVAALAAAVAMVIVVVGGHDVAFTRGNLDAEKAKQALGRFDLLVISGTDEDAQADQRRGGTSPPAPAISEEIVSRLQNDPRVREVITCCAAKVECCPSGPIFRTAMHRPGMLLSCQLAAVTAKQPPQELVAGQWVDAIPDYSVVIDKQMAFPLGDAVGSSFQLISRTGRHDVTIGGVLDSPFPIRRLQAIYVCPKTFTRLTGQPAATNRILIDLAEGVSRNEFADELAGDARRAGTPVHIESADDYIEEAKRWASFRTSHGQSGAFFPLLRNAEMNLAILAALFVIFNTFSMGVQERMRQWGVLRAVGMTRLGLLTLIAVEGFLLATLGWGIGVGAGYWLMRESLSQLASFAGYDLTIHVGLWLTLGAVTAYGAVFLASIIPAIGAVRKRPLDAMTGTARLRATKGPRWMILLGLLLVALNPLSVLSYQLPDAWADRTLPPLGILASLVGFVLLLPSIVILCERIFSHVAGAIFRLDHRLLRKQLSANLWRVVGCLSALTVGLGLFVTIQVWGRSMMVPFMVPERCPDAVVTVFPGGVPDEKLPEINRVPGVESAVPMILQHPALANLPDTVPVGGIITRDVIYIGTDAPAMIGDDKGIIACSFLRGDPAEAYRLLNEGRYCLITDSLYIRCPECFDVGKTLNLDTLDPPRRTLTYTIVGVIRMKGWHLLTMSAQMRRGLSRVGGMVLTSANTARADYPGANNKTFWLNLTPGTDAMSLEFPIVKLLDPNARLASPDSPSASRAASRPAHRPDGKPDLRTGPLAGMGRSREGRGGPPPRAAGASGPRRPGGPGRGGPPGRGRGMDLGDYSPQPPIESNVYCRVTDTAAMTRAIVRRSEGIIQALTFYPLLALGLASLAVVNTMILSVRVRNWESGVLRSLGLTRSGLLRYVLAEGMLIGLLACVASLAFGLPASWTGILGTSHSMGVSPVYVIPWATLCLGLAAAVVLCILAAVAPAIWAATRTPLKLLQEGRAAE
ncbi:MAG: ABC transporter permease [Phycisphaerae bacterium]|nr:ABC transporter permease [Phycisphaerae bacterium]